MIIKEMEKRVNRLEQQNKHPDLAVKALDALSDEELDVLEECVTLHEAGFKPEQIEEMLGERFVIFRQAEKALNQRYAALLKGKPESKPV